MTCVDLHAPVKQPPSLGPVECWERFHVSKLQPDEQGSRRYSIYPVDLWHDGKLVGSYVLPRFPVGERVVWEGVEYGISQHSTLSDQLGPGEITIKSLVLTRAATRLPPLRLWTKAPA